MSKQIIRFLNTIMIALVAGSVFGIWLGYDPRSLSAPTFVEQQQNAIRHLNTLMPILGMIATVLTIVSAVRQKNDKRVFTLLLVAIFFMLISGLTTKFGNQPINSIVMTWDKNSPPSNWMELRDKWWTFHQIRTATTFIALGLITWSNMKND